MPQFLKIVPTDVHYAHKTCILNKQAFSIRSSNIQSLFRELGRNLIIMADNLSKWDISKLLFKDFTLSRTSKAYVHKEIKWLGDLYQG